MRNQVVRQGKQCFGFRECVCMYVCMCEREVGSGKTHKRT